MNTTVTKGRNGWKANTVFVLVKDHHPEYGNLILELTTGKINDKFMALASCAHKKNGMTTTVIGYGRPEGDFFKRIAYYDGPCTERKVRKFHDALVDSAPAWVAEAKRHYGIES